MESEVKQQIFKLFFTVLTIIFLATGIVHLVENIFRAPANRLDFFQVFYFIVVTITTVGYGDVVPKSYAGRAIVVVMIMLTIVLIPRQTNKLLHLLAFQSYYARAKFKPSDMQEKHILVIGEVNSKGVQHFFHEFFYEEASVLHRIYHAVVLYPELPSPEMREILEDPRYARSITYLQGSPMSRRDLRRAKAHAAEGCFVLTNKFGMNADEEDAATILRALSVKRYAHQKRGRDILTCIQLLRPENKVHFVGGGYLVRSLGLGQHRDSLALGLSPSAISHSIAFDNDSDSDDDYAEDAGAMGQIGEFGDLVVCNDEIKMNLLAKNCMCPGVSTLIANLMSTRVVEKSLLKHVPWMREYAEGASNELFFVPLSKQFEGVPFVQVSRMLYKVSGACLFGLEINPEDEPSRVVLNPGDFIIPSIERYNVYGFVIARDYKSAHLLRLSHRALLQRQKERRGSFGQMRRRASSRTSDSIARLDSFMSSAGAKSAGGRGIEMTTLAVPDFDDVEASRSRADSDLPPLVMGDEEHKPGATHAGLGHVDPDLLQLRDLVADYRRSELARTMERKRAEEARAMPDAEEETVRRRRPHSRRGSIGLLSLSERGKLVAPKVARRQRRASKVDMDGVTLRTKLMTREHAPPLEEVTLHSVGEDMPDMVDHVLVCGSISNLYHFLLPLRDSRLDRVKPIVILHPEPIPPHVWNKIGFFAELYFVYGLPSERADLVRAGAHLCSRAIILAHSHSLSSQTRAETLVDADTIFTYQGIVALNSDAQVSTEVVNHANIVFLSLNPGGALGLRSPASSHSLRRGSSLGGSGRDSPMGFSSPGGSGEDGRDSAGDGGEADVFSTKESRYFLAPPFAAGSVYTSSMLDQLIAQAFFKPRLITMLRLLVGGEDVEAVDKWNDRMRRRLGLLQGSNLLLIPLPWQLSSRSTWADCQEHFLGRGIVPIALFRGVWADLGHGLHGNRMPYVYTNPAPDTELDKVDRVFVLSTDKLHWPDDDSIAASSSRPARSRSARRRRSVSGSTDSRGPPVPTSGLHISIPSAAAAVMRGSSKPSPRSGGIYSPRTSVSSPPLLARSYSGSRDSPPTLSVGGARGWQPPAADIATALNQLSSQVALMHGELQGIKAALTDAGVKIAAPADAARPHAGSLGRTRSGSKTRGSPSPPSSVLDALAAKGHVAEDGGLSAASLTASATEEDDDSGEGAWEEESDDGDEELRIVAGHMSTSELDSRPIEEEEDDEEPSSGRMPPDRVLALSASEARRRSIARMALLGRMEEDSEEKQPASPVKGIIASDGITRLVPSPPGQSLVSMFRRVPVPTPPPVVAADGAGGDDDDGGGGDGRGEEHGDDGGARESKEEEEIDEEEDADSSSSGEAAG
eukprot:PLAT9022.1.p1 GENE.PLAT9022.1~~PLAT9022.1.p1  ORF type:complete len:1547 (-),score=755.29 PLAT9022.1:64-4188(-)